MAKKMDARQYIRIRGANENNLKNIDVDIPRNELVILTGLSGSGKSSLAFDTIYAEGQRRYMESLSSYARQFLGQMEKDPESMSRKELEKLVRDLEKQMKKAAAELNFEVAAELRDKLIDLKKMLNDMDK